MKNIIHILIFLLHSSISYIQIYTYQLSSYILDICKRISASDFSITLHKMNKDKSWTIISTNITDINGRVTNLLPYTKMNNDGIYKQTF